MIFKFGELPGGSTLNKAVNTAKSVVSKAANKQINITKTLPGPVGSVIDSAIGKKLPKFTPKQAANTVADMTVRPVVRAGYEATKTIMKDNKPFTPKGRVEKAILGSETLRNYNDPNRTSSKIAKKAGVPGAGPLIALGGAALDATSLSPSGVGKGVGKGVVKKVITKAPEEAGAAYKFGKTLQNFAQEARNLDFAKSLKLERDINTNLMPSRIENWITKGNKMIRDERGFINFGADVEKPNLKSSLELSKESARSSSGNINAGVTGNILDNNGQKLLGPGDPEARIKEVLTKSGLKRSEQEALYTKERGQRFGQLDTAFEQAGGGEAGVFAKLDRLKGEYEKVDFDPIRKEISTSDVNNLINKIESSTKLTRIEKVPAQKAFIGLLDGKLPTESEIEKLRQVFPKDLVDAMVKNPSKSQKIINALNLPRTLQSSVDLSAPLRQGIFPAMAHPKDFTRAFKNMFGYAFSQKKFDNFHEELTKRPTYLKMREAGMQYTDIDGALSNREEAFVSNLTEKIPVIGKFVKGSARAYSGFLNNFRADLFDTLYKNAEKMGRGNDEKLLKDMAKYINTATGRGSWEDVIGKRGGEILTEASPLLNVAFFSPRLIASRLSLMNPVYYKRLDPMVRKDALKSLVAFTTTGMSILGLAALAGAEVGTDPRSADFGKIKMGDTRYDL